MKAWSDRQIKINAQVIADQRLTEANNAFEKAREKLLESAIEFAVAEKAVQLALEYRSVREDAELAWDAYEGRF